MEWIERSLECVLHMRQAAGNSWGQATRAFAWSVEPGASASPCSQPSPSSSHPRSLPSPSPSPSPSFRRLATPHATLRTGHSVSTHRRSLELKHQEQEGSTYGPLSLVPHKHKDTKTPHLLSISARNADVSPDAHLHSTLHETSSLSQPSLDSARARRSWYATEVESVGQNQH